MQLRPRGSGCVRGHAGEFGAGRIAVGWRRERDVWAVRVQRHERGGRDARRRCTGDRARSKDSTTSSCVATRPAWSCCNASSPTARHDVVDAADARPTGLPRPAPRATHSRSLRRPSTPSNSSVCAPGSGSIRRSGSRVRRPRRYPDCRPPSPRAGRGPMGHRRRHDRRVPPVPGPALRPDRARRAAALDVQSPCSSTTGSTTCGQRSCGACVGLHPMAAPVRCRMSQRATQFPFAGVQRQAVIGG